jgi:molecular chaperone DnaJ
MPGKRINLEIHIDLKVVLMGQKAPVSFKRHDTCTECAGSGLLKDKQQSQCKDCGGSGSRSSYQRTGNAEIKSMWPCGSCKGRGKWVAPEDSCKVCSGHGLVLNDYSVDINIPKGINESVEIVARGEGSMGSNGGPRGDVYVRCIVKPDDRFVRERIDLITELPISYTQACLGANLSIELLDGSLQPVEIPPHWNGEEIVITGQGLPDLRSIAKGNLKVKIRIKTPKSLTEEYRALLEQMSNLEKINDAQNN